LLAQARAMPEDGRVAVFLLLGWVPIPLLLALALALYLTAVELRRLQLHYVWWVWWLLLVFLTHFVGYLILRAYSLYRRSRVAERGVPRRAPSLSARRGRSE
jgi:hypothetical protein